MKFMEAPVHVTMENVRAEKAAALLASARKVAVKTEADCVAQPCETSSGKRRKLAEGESSASETDTSCPPGFTTNWWKTPPVTGEDGGKQWGALRQHRQGNTGDWKAASQLLQRTVTPSRELELAASKPADVVASSYLSLLQVSTRGCELIFAPSLTCMICSSGNWIDRYGNGIHGWVRRRRTRWPSRWPTLWSWRIS
jgi:hypothetical protein